ncbi:hypothetical protein TrST_g832 [Triparma strigata]|uniref:Uncharacterized protein n=1 Tax=Triparma strigata TaxID=1606541 RepID=A0A9W7BXG0_9STRA|nr:hypothetical protein TrST_g832 [Triparma strigata]
MAELVEISSGSSRVTEEDGEGDEGEEIVQSITVTASIPDLYYQNNATLTSVDISNACVSLGDFCFYHCTGVRTIRVPEGCREIGWSAFNGCAALSKLEVGMFLRRIGNRAFMGCKVLEPFRFPDSVEEVGFGLFDGCDLITKKGAGEEVDQDEVICMLKTVLTEGEMALYERRYEDVKKFYERIWEERKEALGAEHERSVEAHGRLALAYSEIGELDESLAAYKACYNFCSKEFGESSVRAIEMLDNISLVLLQQKNYTSALEISKSASNWYREEFGEDHAMTLKATAAVGEVYSQMGDYQQAVWCYADSHEGHVNVHGKGHSETLRVLTNLAYNYQQNNQPVKALMLYQEAKETYTSSDDMDNAVEAILGMASCNEVGGEHDKAVACYLQALEIYVRLCGEKDHNSIEVLGLIGGIYKKQEKWGEALKCFEKAQELLGGGGGGGGDAAEYEGYYAEDIDECQKQG